MEYVLNVLKKYSRGKTENIEVSVHAGQQVSIFFRPSRT